MRGTIAAIGLAVLAMITAGCDSGDSSAAQKTTPPTAATPFSPAPTSTWAAEALTAYRNMWAAVARAQLTSDYQSPDIPRYAADQALGYFVVTTKDNHSKGIVSKGEPIIAPRVTRETTESVTVADCVDDSTWLNYSATTGKPIDDVPGGHHRGEAVVTKSPDGWKVTHLTLEGVGTC
ncbi:hypothetical protein [Embleya sp. NPDC020630]|uniref:hypothetical protein n=1 Tax=Embleya sp. NPDC020630 TaxID=3363979 RepID=UPI0037B2D960